MAKRVGIMTGGGDCPGLNPVIRAVAKTGIGRYGWDLYGIEDAFHGLVDLDRRSPHGTRKLSLPQVEDILSRGGTILGTSNRSDPFRFPRRTASGIVLEDVSAKVVENYQKLGLDAIVTVGGDGSMRIASRLMDLGINMVGVPKTIDNDLASTDFTFGFDTAVQTATDALDRLRDTAESHDRIMLVEVMGRNAGFIALHAGIAGGAHAILLPEIPYRVEPLAWLVDRRFQVGRPYTIIVVAEGAVPVGGTESVIGQAAGGMPVLGGAAARVAEALSRALGPEVDTDIRSTVLGHIQRGGSPTHFDRILGTRMGQFAAELVEHGRYGTMASLRGEELVAVQIRDAAQGVKRVDPNGQLVRSARALGVIFGDEEDAPHIIAEQTLYPPRRLSMLPRA